ncbi:hypothetical protein [Chryseobacterium viscerum]|uniref:Uncharacterized protein n=1 Tax=Chryseobacterium viscerum TaxID=1037377 RepID=A0A5N4BMX9_9FLAO|nr:hypothetical protein [Chryseobacterium viscerum]KAB1229760.1 hypothetical protein F8D52_15925 [Chryseobacterium viscerum]
METIILEKIKTVEFREYEVKKPRHIFENLIEEFRKDIPEDVQAGLFYYMNLSEKSLSAFRVGNITLGNYHYTKMQSMRSYFIDPIYHGMISLDYALLAYKNYVENDFELAEENINRAIDSALIQSNAFPYFSIIIGEQSLNKIRVFARTKNEELYKAEVLRIIAFFMFNKHENERYKNIAETLPLIDKQGILKHIINNSYIAILKSLQDEKKTRLIFQQIFNELIEQNEFSGEHENLLIAMRCIAKIEDEDFLDFLNENFSDIKSSPQKLVKIVIENYLDKVSITNNQELVNDEEFTKKLKTLGITI